MFNFLWNKPIVKYQEPLFRPPAEAESLIFQVAYGCPHNHCRFCAMYKGVRYRIRPLDEVLEEFCRAAACDPAVRRIFLADGDVMMLPFETLHPMLSELNRVFPQLARVNLYANGSSILDKTPEQLRELRKLKLNTLYVGLESGDQALLDRVSKRESATDMAAAVRLAAACGLKSSVMVLLGLGGRDGSTNHVLKTAECLNVMQPRLLSALRFIDVPGTAMYTGYRPVTEYEAVVELLSLIENLELEQTVFRANHSSNPAPLEGRFPQDKPKLSAYLQALLNGNDLDRHGPGRLPFSL